MVIGFFSLSVKSIALGMLFGLLSAYLLKILNMTYSAVKEITIILMIAYSSYLSAEALAFSGIISMFTCGLFMSHYTYWNISKEA